MKKTIPKGAPGTVPPKTQQTSQQNQTPPQLNEAGQFALMEKVFTGLHNVSSHFSQMEFASKSPEFYQMQVRLSEAHHWFQVMKNDWQKSLQQKPQAEIVTEN